MSRVRKIYNLRRTSNIKAPATVEQPKISSFKEESNDRPSEIVQNSSRVSQTVRESAPKIHEEIQEKYEVDAEEIVIDKLQLEFDVKVADIERKDVKIKNIGNSAIYLQFIFKNQPKINQNGFKDTKPKFFCHYETNVIKPGEQITFIFAFLSQFPGSFTEQVDICCNPPIKTVIPPIILSGRAFIEDQLRNTRASFRQQLHDVILKEQVKQVLRDIVDAVKLPPPPLPDVSNPEVAERQFQSQNKHLNLFYNSFVHAWFDELYNQICEKQQINKEQRYWNQSVQTLKTMIQLSANMDQVDKKCFNDRLQHYCYLSSTSLPNKSQLYSTVYEFVADAAYKLGGDYVDEVRREMDMWEIPFREPLETDTEEDEKVRKEEVEKIKAEWLKRAKKKKWGEEEEKEMINQYKSKVQAKVTDNILNRFDKFQANAEFVKAQQWLKTQTFDLTQYGKFLERLKTVKESSFQGKKVLLKWHLKLKENCEQKLTELQEYLTKKKEQEKRLEEEKKNESTKKKKAVKPKKKGAKQQEQKPLFFDFMSILDNENWQGFTETFRLIMEKQPFIVFIGITYGPRNGRFIPKYSVQFLLEFLKNIEPSIDFFPHQHLPTLEERIITEAIPEGSILLLQNLNFLPAQVTCEETIQPAAEETQQPTISKRKLLYPQIRQFFDSLSECVDIIVNEDRFLNETSGFTAYFNKEVILGSQWWKYVGISMRLRDATIIFGDVFDANRYKLLHRFALETKQIFLTGETGAKFYAVSNGKSAFANVQITPSEVETIKNFLKQLQEKQLRDKFVVPVDFRIVKKDSEQNPIVLNGQSQIELSEYNVLDIGPQTQELIGAVSIGHLFLLGETAVINSDKCSQSLVYLLKNFHKKQISKQERHNSEASTPSGINYNEDLVIYLVGVDEQKIERVDLKEKKRLGTQQDQNAEQQEEEGDKRKVDLVSDFQLACLPSLYRLWVGEFDYGLRDVTLYSLTAADD